MKLPYLKPKRFINERGNLEIQNLTLKEKFYNWCLKIFYTLIFFVISYIFFFVWLPSDEYKKMKAQEEAREEAKRIEKIKESRSYVEKFNSKNYEIREFISNKFKDIEFISVEKKIVEDVLFQMIMKYKAFNVDLKDFDISQFQNSDIKRVVENGYEGVCINTDCKYIKVFKTGEAKVFSKEKIKFFEIGTVLK